MDPVVETPNGNGNAPALPAYAESLPQELRIPSLLSKYQDLPAYAKGVENLIEYRGKSISIPGTDPKEIETWKTEHMPKIQHIFADRLPPESPDGYEFKIEGIADDALSKDEILGEYRKFAHEIGLSKNQAAKQVEFLAKTLPRMVPKAPEVPQINFIEGENVDLLMKEIFKKDATQTLDQYRKAVDLLSIEIPELKDLLLDSASTYGPRADNKALKLADHPTMVKLVNLVAKMTQPDFAGNVNGGRMSSDAEELIAEAKDIQNNKDNPKYKFYWASDKHTVEYVNSLYARAYPGEVQI